MMTAMGLKSPAPIQSRLKHLYEKGLITWQEGRARTLALVEKNELGKKIPILGSVAAGGLIDTFNDCFDELDITSVLENKNIFALTVNGDSMIDACIADGDMVLMEKVMEPASVRNGTIVSALVPGSGTTLKYYKRKGEVVILEPANTNYEPINVDCSQVTIQGKLLAVWRRA